MNIEKLMIIQYRTARGHEESRVIAEDAGVDGIQQQGYPNPLHRGLQLQKH